MKTNGQMDHSSKPCLRKEVHRTWAKYMSRWITAVQRKRVPIWAITVQNEPGNNATWEGCLMTPQEEAEFLGTHLGPVLQEEHPNVLVFAYDHNKDHVYWWANVTYSHPLASKYVDGIAFHWYSGDSFDDIKRIHKEIPQALLLASEATYERWRWHKGSSVATGDWSFGEGYAHDIIGDLNAGSIGWIDWNLLLDETGGPNHVNNVCDAAMIADMQKGELYFHPQYYFIGHFSKFIPPGSVHLQTNVFPAYSYRGQQRNYGICTWEDGLQVTSFLRPDGFIATVVLNCGDVPIKFKLRAGHRAAEASIPAHAIQTYLFEETGASPLRPHSVGSPSLATGFVGVNLGGWLLLEDWMWEKEMRGQQIPDEHTLVKRYGGPHDPRAVAMIQAHRETFVTETDIDRLRDFGVSHVRVPVGYWLVDYDPADGFIDGTERYLYRLLRWLQVRGMRCVIDLHALPGAQVTGQSFTGKKSNKAYFFLDEAQHKRGRRAMVRIAKLILGYEKDPSTAGVVMGFELVNEPGWDYWRKENGVKQLYDEMVPVLRRYLPANRFVLLLNFMESPRYEGSEYLASRRTKDPTNWNNVIYDAHTYHAFGDDDKHPGPKYEAKRGGIDACKTCCRDNLVLDPMVQLQVPIVIGEYSLNTGFAGNPDFYDDFLRSQLSLWATTQGVIGSFFWNFRILRNPGGWFKEMSLLELVQPEGPIAPVSRMDLSRRCPDEDLSLCPVYDPREVRWTTECQWRTTTSTTTTGTSTTISTSTETETTTTETITTISLTSTSSARPTSTASETTTTETGPKAGRGEHRHRDGLKHMPGFGDMVPLANPETTTTETRPKAGKARGEHGQRDGLKHMPGFGDMVPLANNVADAGAVSSQGHVLDLSKKGHVLDLS